MAEDRNTGVLSKGTKLSYKSGSDTTYTDLDSLISIPAIGGNKDSIEITDLGKTAHTYMAGLENYGDSLNFQFIMRPEDSQITTLKDFADDDTDVHWQLTLSSGHVCTFDGTCSVQIDGKTYNEALTYTLSIKPGTAITIA